MFKAGTLLLAACLFTAPVLAQECPKSTKTSDAAITQLKDELAKAQAALKKSLEAERRAKEEALVALEQAEAARKVAEVERDKALVAREQAEKARQVAERSRLEALRAAELAAVEEARARVAAKEAATKAKGDAAAKDPKPERGKKRGGKRAALAQQVEALTKQMQQLQMEVNALKTQLKKQIDTQKAAPE